MQTSKCNTSVHHSLARPHCVGADVWLNMPKSASAHSVNCVVQSRCTTDGSQSKKTRIASKDRISFFRAILEKNEHQCTLGPQKA